jgi:penicillin-binding protein 1A
MTDDDRTGYSSAAAADRVASVLSPVRAPERRRRGLFRRRKRNRRMRWLRLLAILVPLSFLAVISTVFGMVLAFAPQLGPLALKLQTTYKNGLNSVIYSAGPHSQEIGILTNKNQFFLPSYRIPLIMDHAIVAVEDKRFYTEPGIDYRGIGRALVNDVFHTGGGTQGASTITEQFVKIALGAEEQNHRSIFNKFKEAALAFQLYHLWPKDRILAEYLNSAYFGNGAYGIESAARAYFGNDPSSNLYGCGKVPNIKDPASLCVTNLTADEAALLAGLVASPTTYAVLLSTQPAVVEARRNIVLKDMAQQDYLSQQDYLTDSQYSLPPAANVQSPSEEATKPSAGYFVQWIEGQLVSKYHQAIYSAGYHIHTTLDWGLQQAAQAAVDHMLPSGIGGPTASLVAIDNKTGEVKAMVGGYDFSKNQFNLATQAERQPGSAFKVFDLAVALEDGYNQNSKFLSAPYDYPGGVYGLFKVRNDEHSYFGVPIPLWEALAYSDNSVFSRLGLKVGTRNIAALAHSFGISTTISHNPSMVIGGLHIGVTPLDMAHAYETIAEYGQLISGTMASNGCAAGGTPQFSWEEDQPALNSCPGPVGIDFISQPGGTTVKNEPRTFLTNLTAGEAAQEISMMHGVMQFGTGTAAQIPGVKAWGKTGTTSQYIDAWFVGSTPQTGPVPSMTVAVWVGFPNSSKSMAKSFGGKPVYGGTYPALIWRAYVTAAIQQYKREAAGLPISPSSPSGSTTSTGATTGSTTPNAGATGATSPTGATPATNTGGVATPATHTPAGATTPSSSTGTVTGGGGSSAPPATTPSTPSSTPPPTTSSGGVTAPGGGVTAPPTSGP